QGHEGEIDAEDGECGPRADQPAPPPSEDEEGDGAAEGLRLRADDLVEQEVAPPQRRRKEEGDLRLAELQAAGSAQARIIRARTTTPMMSTTRSPVPKTIFARAPRVFLKKTSQRYAKP